MKNIFFLFIVFFSLTAFSQEKKWTAGLNIHKLGIRVPKYLTNENIRVGYWFQDYHQAGVEIGVYRDATQSYPTGGIYYRFQPLKSKLRPFFEGRAKTMLIRNIFSGNQTSFIWSIYSGLSFELSQQFSLEIAIGKSRIDWDQFIGFNFKF